ncbi:UDP-N-acetylmuramoylalanyl-D-glutamyl-2,6-diaminopimelate--D-alanyl-D-alanine ligase [Cohaesibacter sp. CAU 1516]|uniref:UDP-N-acetylmuramoylalanyl-D-glutamyl-2, 6-diaminopimelate--D-alanyl-D-alanine ligase n=1 Tax=Cohaesibacter sp. CAU 1516 TaxID=2576038 RepID=UPI0010FE6155|nr:UDP-N-acetylmuramoylalanyl-D-glutamyl-2,6-diaminopimelate--D-alanyl-D-alanine ligase [Cohaesibacter sp. CAU 1516]TLP48437.1 UDP-N-acetylmuramoylalanyl-D-glutamyl-2,6-diaminopimelate--D-alanyl-D-alanine ligase [Cohaesibacter sp. CAU 1516]
MSVLWTTEAFVAAVSPVSQPGGIKDVTGISIDSRTIGEGDAFFAIKGDQFDGHAFARTALEAGAAVVVLDEAQRADFADIGERVVFVDDVLKALERLGRAARARMKGKVIAITGSVGKTSTKDALRAALAPSGRLHAANASFNNHWGVPLTLARMPEDAEFGIFEVGMNHPGEIRTLIDMVKPHLAAITTIVAAHIGNFNSIDEIAAAKAEIFEGVVEGGAVLLNADNAFDGYLTDIAKDLGIAHIHHFGRAAHADIRLEALDLQADGSDLTLSLFGEPVSCHVAAAGEHLAMNALAVFGLVRLAGGDVEAACLALGTHGASKGRGERHELAVRGGTVSLIDESYNANPSSVAAALATLGLSETKGRKIAVLGDMLELGEESAEMHAALLPAIQSAGIDRLYLCGPMMAHLWEIAPVELRGIYANSSADLVAPLCEALRDGDAVMVKGSLGSRMGPIVQSLLEEFKQ